MSLQWQNPNAFWLLLGVALLAFVMIWKGRHFPGTFSWRRFLIALAAFSVGICGLARPQWGQRILSRQGLKSQVFIAIDISRSMLAEDVTPSRLGFSVAFCQRLLTQLTGARVALFPFALNGYLQMPLTTDLLAIHDMLSALNPSMTTAQGTDISQSLSTLLQHIDRTFQLATERGEELLPTQVILLSDGEHHPALRDSVLKEFRNRRIPIFTVGVGTPNGTTVPSETKWGFTHEPMKDNSGKPVLSKLNSASLKRISEKTGGDYFSSHFSEVYTLKHRLTQNMKYGKLASTFKVEREYYPFLFLIVFTLFLAEFFSARWEYAIRSLAWFIGLGLLLTGTAVHAEKDPDEPRKRNPEAVAADLYNDTIGEKKNISQTLESLQEALSLSKDPSLRKRILFNLGNAFLRAGDPVQAMQTYQQVLDTHANEGQLEQTANERASDNLVLAKKILEEQKKKEQAGKGNNSDDGKGQNPPPDPQGPKKQYAAQPFSEQEKQKMFDYLSGEEQRIRQRLQEEQNRQPRPDTTDKPW